MSDEIIIRNACLNDLKMLHPMIERAYRGESARRGWTHEADLLDGERTSLDVLEAIVENPEQYLLIAIRGGVTIGCVAVANKGEGLAYLGQLCVEPELQTFGSGKRLIAEAEQAARDMFGARRIELTVIDSRVELIAYYQRRGYAVTGERRDFPMKVDPPLFMTVLEKPLGTLVDQTSDG